MAQAIGLSIAEAIGLLAIAVILAVLAAVLWRLGNEKLFLVTIRTAAGQLEGIPFYTKKGVCKQETVWVEPVFTVTYTKTTKYQQTKEPIDDKQKPPDAVESGTKFLSLSQLNSDVVCELRKMIAGMAGGVDKYEIKKIDEKWKTLCEKEADYIPLENSIEELVTARDAVMVSNTASPEVITDYSSVHYYNARRPVIGSGELTVKLNADGTLGEGTTKMEDKTLQSVLEFAPAKDLLGVAKGKTTPESPPLEMSAAQKAILDQRGPGEWQAVIQVQLTITQADYRHIRTGYSKYTDALSCTPEHGGLKPGCSETIETPSDRTAKNDKANLIDVAGTIKLPAKPAADDKVAKP